MEACKLRDAPVANIPSTHSTLKTDRSIALVNIVSRTYTARLAKERLEGQL